ncbi:tRNA lysidine(34) synthetase TilS [Pseudonocardia aurantiaca]|uniref:tRNA(Ile)-lysidine synthase n=1 Tax=Pseudonocardia aurantiaca TaxID=75290 RepID=A0ABW4FWZ0_9PSEU
MGRATPEVAQVRRAVRTAVAALPGPYRSAPLLVACSGGADSVALAAAAMALRGSGEVHAAVVDHGLQNGSAEQAAAVVELLTDLGAVASVHRVEVSVGNGGVEAAARRARYGALRAARPHERSPVLLGHTLDDQAETVLLGLGRGSGGRSIAGMRAWDAPWLRPLLAVRRSATRAACAASGLPVWDDPHNTDPRFTRVRLRQEVLPLLEDVLSGGVAEALARTAAQLREDVDALDEMAAGLLAAAVDPAADPVGRARPLRLDALAQVTPALRRRVLRAWLATAGVTALTDTHLRAADVLAAQGGDRGGVAVPGGLELVRERGTLFVRPVRWPAGSPEPQQEDLRRV